MSIPDVGEKTAIRIIEDRPYATFEELDEVEGIGPKLLDTLKIHGRIDNQQGGLVKPTP